MLFHTWPFFVFRLVVLPVFFSLRKTRLWLPWLTAASYFFYGWWNPYYLFLVLYSTVLDFSLVALMDHCLREGKKVDVVGRLTRLRFDDRVLKCAFIGSLGTGLGIIALALVGPQTLRPTMTGLGLLVLLMGWGALHSSRRIWLLISLVNNLALLLFFKYARFVAENLNAIFSSVHLPIKLADPSALMPFGFQYLLPVGISFFTFQSLSYTIDFYFGKVHRERNFSQVSIPSWTLEDDGASPPNYPNSYKNPFAQITFVVPSAPRVDPDRGPGSLRHKPWSSEGEGTNRFDWVALDSSLQWQAFRRVLKTLRARGNNVLVILGPFNEHFMAEENRRAYRKTRDGIAAWLTENHVPHVASETLPNTLYADDCHPLTEGYQLLAQRLYENPAFQDWLR